MYNNKKKVTMKALITKLNGTIGNSDILKLGEMRVYFSKKDDNNKANRGIILAFNKDVEVSVVNGHFTDSTLEQDLGTTSSFLAGSQRTLFVSNDDCYISIPNKYVLKRISGAQSSYLSSIKFDIEDLAYSTAINRLEVGYSNVYGDIDKLEKLKDIAFLIFSGTEIESTNSIFAIDSLIHLEVSSRTTLDAAKIGKNVLYFDGGHSKKISWSNRESSNSIFGMHDVHLGGNTDAALINLSACTYKQEADNYSSYKKIQIYGKRTSASDSAISILQNKGYTITITPE